MNFAPARPRTRLLALGTVILIFAASASAQNQTAASAPPPPAASVPEIIPELHVGNRVYQNVRVREVTATSIVIQYRGGLGSVLLADLPPEWQQHFGYDPAKAAAATAHQQAQVAAIRAQEAGSPLAATGSMNSADRALENFGQPPKVFQEVNMRPRFEQLGIDAKNQGARPSCAVFAVVSALEFQQSVGSGPAPRLSEEYLIWATLKTLGKVGVRVPKQQTPGFDVGFSLVEVTQALRAYGIALESEQPYHFTMDSPRVVEPDPDIVSAARLRSPVNGYFITGREPAMQLANLVQVLNQGIPVVAGVKWPTDAAVNKTGVLDTQNELDKAGHAILIVGYRTSTGRLEDAQFLFKNSYGAGWGDHGYGLASYAYLEKNLEMAMFMDVR